MGSDGRAAFLACALPLLLMTGAAGLARPRPAATRAAPTWRFDLTEARTVARRDGKPLFVVFRDERDPRCRAFDEKVIRLDETLPTLADRFVLVRIADMRGVDLNLFDFDYDLTWMGFFLNANAHVYGRFGGRDAGAADAHLTVDALGYAMRRALVAYRTTPDADGPLGGTRSRVMAPRRVEQNPLAAERTPMPECIHCHHVYEFRRDALRRAGHWHGEMAWVYPWPENIGLTVDAKQPDRIEQVKADSAADRAGVRAGDRLKTLNDYPIASYGDIQYALHRAPTAGRVPIRWEREGQERTGEIVLAPGWRATDLTWRASMWRLSPAPSVEGADLTPDEKARLGLPADRLAFRQYDTVWPNARAAGIQPGDIIVGIDDKPFSMTMMQFLIHIRVNYRAGDRVVFNLYRNGQRQDIPMILRDVP